VAADVAAQLVKLERDLASLRAQASAISENYGIHHLHYAVATSYVSGLMNNDAVASWLAQHYPEYTAELQAASSRGAKTERTTPRF
jgi:RepB plasmid partitioning protein